MRVVAASFLVKHLLLPWQWGLKHFWEVRGWKNATGGESLGWAVTGSGGMADAKPFNYLVDVGREASVLDEDGEFVRRWVPALSQLPLKYIHCPWKAPPEVLAIADVELGGNYPRPVISLDESIRNLKHAVDVLDKTSSSSWDRAYKTPHRGRVGAQDQVEGCAKGKSPPVADQLGGTDGPGRPGTGDGTGTGTGTQLRDFGTGGSEHGWEPGLARGNGIGSMKGSGSNEPSASGVLLRCGDESLNAETPVAAYCDLDLGPPPKEAGATAAQLPASYYYEQYYKLHEKSEGFYFDVRNVPEDMILAIGREFEAVMDAGELPYDHGHRLARNAVQGESHFADPEEESGGGEESDLGSGSEKVVSNSMFSHRVAQHDTAMYEGGSADGGGKPKPKAQAPVEEEKWREGVPRPPQPAYTEPQTTEALMAAGNLPLDADGDEVSGAREPDFQDDEGCENEAGALKPQKRQKMW
eukprot:gene5884-33455_t